MIKRIAPEASFGRSAGKAMRLACFAIALSLIAGASTSAFAQDRLPGIPWDKLSDAQKKIIKEGVHAPGGKEGNAPMSGSAHYLIRIPEVYPLVGAMVQHTLRRSALNPRLTEMAILQSAREFTSQFQWYNHAPDAKEVGVSTEIINAIAEGRRPSKMAEDEELVYDFNVEVFRTQSVSDATFAKAVAKFGEAGVVELVHIQGLYAYLGNFFNVMRHPLPPGSKPELPPFPRNQ